METCISLKEIDKNIKKSYLIPTYRSLQLLQFTLNSMVDFSYLKANKFTLFVEKRNLFQFFNEVKEIIDDLTS